MTLIIRHELCLLRPCPTRSIIDTQPQQKNNCFHPSGAENQTKFALNADRSRRQVSYLLLTTLTVLITRDWFLPILLFSSSSWFPTPHPVPATCWLTWFTGGSTPESKDKSSCHKANELWWFVRLNQVWFGLGWYKKGRGWEEGWAAPIINQELTRSRCLRSHQPIMNGGR